MSRSPLEGRLSFEDGARVRYILRRLFYSDSCFQDALLYDGLDTVLTSQGHVWLTVLLTGNGLDMGSFDQGFFGKESLGCGHGAMHHHGRLYEYGTHVRQVRILVRHGT